MRMIEAPLLYEITSNICEIWSSEPAASPRMRHAVRPSVDHATRTRHDGGCMRTDRAGRRRRDGAGCGEGVDREGVGLVDHQQLHPLHAPSRLEGSKHDVLHVASKALVQPQVVPTGRCMEKAGGRFDENMRARWDNGAQRAQGAQGPYHHAMVTRFPCHWWASSCTMVTATVCAVASDERSAS